MPLTDSQVDPMNQGMEQISEGSPRQQHLNFNMLEPNSPFSLGSVRSIPASSRREHEISEDPQKEDFKLKI